MKFSLKGLRSEKPLIAARLEHALKCYFDAPSKENLYNICDELVYAYVYNILVHIPVDVEGTRMLFGMQYLRGLGYAYIACTTAEELVKCPEETSVVVSWRSVLSRAAQDTGSAGIVINPHSGSTALALLNRENAGLIIKNAEETIDQLPFYVRKDVRNGI